jgi:hypothetical protein
VGLSKEKLTNTIISYFDAELPFEYPVLLTTQEQGVAADRGPLSLEQDRFLAQVPIQNQTREKELKRQQEETRFTDMIRKLKANPLMPTDYMEKMKESLIDWLEIVYDPQKPKESKVRCSKCHSHKSDFRLDQNKINDFAKDPGVVKSTKDKMRDGLKEHLSSGWHTQIVKWEQENEREQMQAAMHNLVGLSYQQLAPEQRATARMLLTVYAESQMYIPFNSHPTLITLLKQLGVNTGVHHQDRFGPPKFIGVVSGEMHRIFLTHMTKYDRPFSLILDTATDSVGNDMLVILFQILENDRPYVLFYKLKQMGVDVTAEGYKRIILDSFEEDKKQHNIDMLKYAEKNLVGFTSDGAAVFSGKHNGLGVLLSRTLKNDSTVLFRQHCLRHKLNLAVRKLVDDVNELDKFESDIKLIARFYNSHNPKNLAHLHNLASVRNFKVTRLTYTFTERWVQSEDLVLKRLRNMYPLLLMDLEAIAADIMKEFAADTTAKARALMNVMRERPFVLLVSFISDIMNLLNIFSTHLQKSGAVLVGKETTRANLFASVRKLETENGAQMNDLMGNLECRKDEHSPAFRPCRSVQDVESSFKVRWVQPIASDHVYLADLRRTSPTKTFVALRKEILQKLTDHLNQQFPEGSFKDFDVFNPRHVEIEKCKTRSYGLTEIRNLANRFKIDTTILTREWQNFWYWFAEQPGVEQVLNKDTDIINFWDTAIKHTGAGMGVQLRKLVRIVLVLPPSSADAERAFSIMKHIKSSRRTRMALKTLDGLMRVSLNGPKDLTKFPAAKYAKLFTGVPTGQVGRMPGRPLKRQLQELAGPSSGKRMFIAEEQVQAEDLRVEQVEQAIRERDMEVEIADDDEAVYLGDNEIGVDERDGEVEIEIFN